MRPLKFHAPYCVYRKQTKAEYFWYVRFWDETSRKYTCIRSTGIPNIEHALDIRKEKGILTPAEVTQLIHVPAADPLGRLVVLLGALCGFAAGGGPGLAMGGILGMGL
jgi:hypothetical protein